MICNTNNRDKLQADGERRKANGISLAAGCKEDLIAAGKLALLDALLASPDGTATIDDATADLTEQFADGGRWRGSVTRSLAMRRIIAADSVDKSDRPSRHRGYVTRWRLRDRDRALELRRRIQETFRQQKSSTVATAELKQLRLPHFTEGNRNDGKAI